MAKTEIEDGPRLEGEEEEEEEEVDLNDLRSTMVMLEDDGRPGRSEEENPPFVYSSSDPTTMDTTAPTGEALAETPLPMKKILVILCILFSESFAATMLFSFVSYMVMGFPGIEEDEVPYYVGWLASSFFVGQFLSSFFWGYFADRYGRRPTLLIGLSGTFISMVWFGMSKTFVSAICARLIGGLLNANFSIGKAVMSDTTDNTNRARGFSYIGMMWGIGSIIGPFLGGALSDPARNISSIFNDTVFDSHPYLLPTVVAASVCLFGLIGTVLYLPETITTAQKQAQEKLELDELEMMEMAPVDSIGSDSSLSADDSESSPEESLPSQEGEKGKTDMASVVTSIFAKSSAPDRDFSEEEPSINVTKEDQTPRVETKLSPLQQTRWQVIKILLTDPTVRRACILYSLLSIIFVTLDEVFPLWLRESPEKGGFGFHERQIGTLWLISGLSLLLFQIFIYPPLVKRIGPLNCFKAGTVISAVSILFLPVTGKVAHLGPGAIWPIVGFVMVWRTWGGTLSFTSANILVNASAPGEYSGSVNGLANSCAGLMRAIGPAFGGAVFGWSIGVNTFPIDRHFVFGVLSLFCLANLVVASLLPRSLGAYGYG